MTEEEKSDQPVKENNSNEDTLSRILTHIEKNVMHEWTEIITVIILALSTVGSAWCAFQSTLWGGVQTFELAAANKAGRDASENVVVGMQKRAFDGILLIHFIEAFSNGDKELQEFYYRRFPEKLRIATDDWLKTDPLNNPDAPRSPFNMSSYEVEQEKKAEEQRQLSSDKMSSAQQANINSDTYVMLTVLFASVLFFGGVSGTIKRHSLKVFIVVTMFCVFIATIIALFTMPMTSIY